MLFSIFLALLLPCAGMAAVFVVYIILLWFATSNQSAVSDLPVKRDPDKGLSESDLEKLPKVSGKELVMGTDCAICLDEIQGEQPARVVPGCNHGFHLQCGDNWLSKQAFCPVCRAKVPPSDESPVPIPLVKIHVDSPSTENPAT